MKPFEYITAESFEAAAAFLSEAHRSRRIPRRDDLLVKAGGIDVLDRLKERLATPTRVLNLFKLHEPDASRRISESDGMIRIHPLTTLAELAASDLVKSRLPALADAAGHAATPQVRNVATIGGNLCQKPRCWYFRSHDFQCLKKGGSTCYAVEGDNRYHAIFGAGACHIVHPSNTAVPLLAYDARLKLVRHADGKPAERTAPLDDFFRVPTNPQDDENVLGPDELIREIEIPVQASGCASGYVEVREKQSFDWPLVTCAANLNDRKDPRIVVGAVAPIPWRLKNVEQLLAAEGAGDAVISKARGLAPEGASPMTHNSYKVQLVGVLVERAIRAAAKA